MRRATLTAHSADEAIRLRAGWALALSLALATVVPGASLGAQEPPQDVPLPVLGIVEVPRLFGTMTPGGPPPEPPAPSPVVLRAEPDAGARVVTTVGRPDLLESREFGYEEAGALVYGREGGWSLLRTREGETGWMPPGDGGPFHSLEALLTDGLTYLTDGWDGALRPAPGASGTVAIPSDPRRRIVGYLEPVTRRIRVELEPGQDSDSVRATYRASASSVRIRSDGTQVMSLEVGTTHPLFARPDSTASVIDHVETHRAAHVLETTSAVPGRVPVFSRRSGWFEVALRSADWRQSEKVWLEAAPSWPFTPVADEAEAEGIMDRVWGPVSRSVRVLEVRSVGERLWVEVEVLSDSPCLALESPTVIARGWVPAHAASGEPTVWFYSRGC